MSSDISEIFTIGWCEWVRLPELGLPAIKVKVDTGARTSALHAFELYPFMEKGIQRIEFSTSPLQHNIDTVIRCKANVIDNRIVTNSGGHKEDRWVIETPLSIGPYSWPVEITLTARDNMKFRMLLGRNAIKNRALVDSSASYIVGQKP